MADFLLELRSEEIPARMQAGARANLARLFGEELRAAGLAPGELTVWSTPRRLALIARDLPLATEPLRAEIKGPRVTAPTQALDGFLRKTGLTSEQLTQRDGAWLAVTERPGRATADVLAAAIPAIVCAFPWPKSMRWGPASLASDALRWVRPLSGIVAILGEDLVACEIAGIAAGFATLGHRFHHPGPITIGGAHDYADKLRACHVIVDHAEREALIRDGATAVAARAGLALVAGEGLVVENAGLTEWPVPLLGRFDPAFLEVPPEVIALTARTNQKYFVCQDEVGKLANAFVCTANIAAHDGGAGIVAGNRKVLAARLSDARFFWEQDRRKTLAEHAEGLARITFHEKLGTVRDKAERVARLARRLVEEGVVSSPARRGGGPPQVVEGFPSSLSAPDAAQEVPLHQPAAGPPPQQAGEDRARLADLAEQAARLCKADLVTAMVAEFPELQGVMGGYYACAEGLPDEVADAIRDHYKPVGQGDDVPTAPVTVAVALADKLDTLREFFHIDEKPTGSKDPFALRRAALGVIALAITNNLRFAVSDFAPFAPPDFVHFFIERLKVQQREAGVRHDLIDAVFALGNEDDLVRLLARVHALQAFVGTADGADLLAGYKRAANILRKENYTPASAVEPDVADNTLEPHDGEEDPYAMVDDPDLGPILAAKLRQRRAPGYTAEPAEAALVAALDRAEPRAARAIAEEDFTAAMAALASLRGPIDAFFEHVTVNDADASKRAARLRLLDRFRAAVHNVADFSKIEG